ncbi:MAG: hypothetical protein KGR46_00305 [Verrucomicrobia bacterium]|nr:hypothetical protein [Verrucomicrobiota bacterium]
MPRFLSIAFLLVLGILLGVFLWDVPQPQARDKPAEKTGGPAAASTPLAIPATTASDHKPGGPRRRNELGQAMAFRERAVEAAEIEKLKSAMPGDRVVLDFFPDVRFRARVDLRDSTTGELRVAGPLVGFGKDDRFFLTSIPGEGRLLVEIPSLNLAYEIAWNPDHAPVAREWLLTDVICASPANDGSANRGIPPSENRPLRTASVAQIDPSQVPIINTRPGAPDVIYMDFDGETVTTSAWAGGATIVAPSTKLTASQIREVISRMERDFEGFNVNITTQRSVYDATPLNSRIHCVVTDNDLAAPGAGGVAYVGSFDDNVSTRKVCWVFMESSAKDCAEAASHEVGHTLGLNHDGRVASGSQPYEEYYEGHGSGSTGWAPIMGVGYYRQLTQWSKGEYNRANNPQDDLTVMTSSTMLSFASDTVGNSTASALAVSGDRADGRIERTNDLDFFSVNLGAGSHTINLLPSAYTNLDAELSVIASNGTTLAAANPTEETGASASFSLASNQTIFLRVSGVGKGDVAGTGYSNYGSLGAYSLTGFGNQQQPPSSPIGLSTTPISGSQIKLFWSQNPSATTYAIYRNGTLIGTTTSTEFLDTAATPGTETSYSVIATNSYGSSPASEPTTVLTPAADEFVMDGSADFGGYLLSNPGMTIYAAVRGNRLYVATWSPGDNGSGFGSDHFLLISDTLLPAATTPAPWGKAGSIAIPSNKPYLAGESTTTYAGWFDAPPNSPLSKSSLNSAVLEGSIDLIAAFGSIPQNVYIASVAYGTNDGNGINSQAPGTRDDDNLGPSEFLRIPVASIRDRTLNGTYDILDPARLFRPKSIGFDSQNRPVLVWDVVPGKRYTVHRTGELSGPWSVLNIGGWNADPGQWEMIYTDTDPNLGARQFYRVTLD